MKQQNNTHLPFNPAPHIHAQIAELLSMASMNQSLQISYQHQFVQYEGQFSQCSKRKQQLLDTLYAGNNPEQEREEKRVQKVEKRRIGFQKLEHQGQIPTNASIRMESQNWGLEWREKDREREVLGERKTVKREREQGKSFGFIPYTFTNEQIIESERESMENLSLKLIPEGPRLVPNLIVYQSI